MQKQTHHKTENGKRAIILANGRQLELNKPLVMGVLNVTPDSFSDGETTTAKKRLEKALKIIREGADIIDIGGESTRPGALPVSEEEELERVIPIIEGIRKESDIPISIDTYKTGVAVSALEAKADIVNDISALRFSPDMPQLIAEKKVPVVLMHMLGRPRDMQKNPHYDNCVKEINEFFEERISYCLKNGIDKSQLILDPGIGFGKRLSDNIEILAGLKSFMHFGLPLVIGASRKSFINMLYPGTEEPARRLGGSIAAAVAAANNGADIIRVHDVHETVEALKVNMAIREQI